MRHFNRGGHSRHDAMFEWGRDAIRAMRGGGRRHGGDWGAGRSGRDWGDGTREGRGRRRMFESGELRLVMLLLMEAEPRHGYDIIREIETRTGGNYAPSPGIVYPTLTLLEEIGQVEARTPEGAKKLFAITEAGLSHLNEKRSEAQSALARLEALAEQDAALDTGPIFRSMSNLRTALKQRLVGKPGRDLVLSVADAIDEVARKIERL
jgi:DNA-binding PadR family transcriptional regulator